MEEIALTALPKTMKAAVTHGADDIRVEDVALPDYEPDDVLVRVEMCGICGTDLHILSGHMRPLWPPAYPFIQGHEWCGTVAALGRNVKRGRPLKGPPRCDPRAMTRYRRGQRIDAGRRLTWMVATSKSSLTM